MNNYSEIIYQLLPIVLGVAFLFGMKSIKIIRSKIRLATENIEGLLGSTIRPSEVNLVPGNNDSVIKELLITEGRLPRNKNANLIKYARENGILTWNSISDIGSALHEAKYDRLVVASINKRLLFLNMVQFCPNAGLLLAYLLDGKLYVVD
jgi:hypothetical protein